MATASDLMAEVTREYELCMSSLVFDSNMMNEANIQVYLGTRSKRYGHPRPPPSHSARLPASRLYCVEQPRILTVYACALGVRGDLNLELRRLRFVGGLGTLVASSVRLQCLSEADTTGTYAATLTRLRFP